MLTAARLREYTGETGALALLRELGYPAAPVDVDPEEWRRGGVTCPWNGDAHLRLAVRLRRFDLFLLSGNVSEDSISSFLRSYHSYNLLTKSALIYCADESVSIFDLAADDSVRRLDVDLANPSPHAIDRLNLLVLGEPSSLPRVFDRALDRESVTRLFFQRFRGAVQDVAKELAERLPGEERKAVDDEALLILSRLLFLSFIQEKGWLSGERRYLVDRLEHEIARGRELFSGVLVPLFFGCLNTPLHERVLAARRLGRIPYLNGGLFEPSPFEQRNPDLHLSNALMQRVVEGVFERFDFRVAERRAGGEASVTHVDPEMLGRVFESLMAEDERAASGSFYTPRQIVDVLTEGAIAEWLGQGDAKTLLAKLSSITVLDPACGSGAFLLSALTAIERMWRKLADEAGVEAPPDLRRRIVAGSLYGVDLKPEAVRLCELRLWLAIVSDSDGRVGTGERAVEPIENIEPLPNLDRNILQGSSLFSPTDFLGDARTDIYAEWLQMLRAQADLLDRYRTAPHGHRPALYRVIRGNDQRIASELLARSIDSAERELQLACAPQSDLFGRTIDSDLDLCRGLQQRIAAQKRLLDRIEEGSLDFFSFDVHFAHVMARGGFDVVIGNPPWVRNSRIDGRTKRMLVDRYALFREHRGGAAFHQPDLSVAFFERALFLAAEQGVVAMLMPSKIVNAGYAGALRRTALPRIVKLDDWSDDPRRKKWFDADTFPLGIVLRREPIRSSDRGVAVTSSGESFALDRGDLPVAAMTSEWALVPPEVMAIVKRLRAAYPPFEEVLGRRPFMGVKTGDNRSFFLDAKAIRDGRLVTSDGIRIPLTAVCRCVRGRDLHRWSADESHWMLWPPVQGWRNKPKWLGKLAAARGVKPDEIRLSFVRPEHVGIKVAWKDLSRGMAAAVLPDVTHINDQAFPLVPNQTLYAIDAVTLDEAYAMAAILNSTVIDALLISVAERAKDSHYRYFGRTVAALPWPDARPAREKLVRLSRRAHRGAHVGAPIEAHIQADIDDVVAGLYGVTADELAMLRAFVERRLGAR